MAGGWGCPHEVDDRCSKVGDLPCNPGMKGCTLAGRFRFANDEKNVRFYEKQARRAGEPPPPAGDESPAATATTESRKDSA